MAFLFSKSRYNNKINDQLIQLTILFLWLTLIPIFGMFVHNKNNVNYNNNENNKNLLNKKLLNINENNNTTIDNIRIQNNRDERFLFTMMRFPNEICYTENDTGVCFTSNQCYYYGGTDLGECAKGYGVCCDISVGSCNSNITINNTLVTSRNYPEYFNQERNCTFEVFYDDDICQIRYDFEAMELSPPSLYGMCDNDKMVFNDDDKSEFFCGVAPDNYHWYVETAGHPSPHTVNIYTDGSDFDRRYAIRVSYITCMQGVPTKCGNWYPGFEGVVESYNFGNGFYLAGLEYSICFRKEIGYCNYTLFPVGNDHYIGGADTLRLPVGDSLELTGVAVLPSTTVICMNVDIRQKAMYFTQIGCNYPEEFTSVNTAAAFFLYIETIVDTGPANVNRNPIPQLNQRSGFKFDWINNKC